MQYGARRSLVASGSCEFVVGVWLTHSSIGPTPGLASHLAAVLERHNCHIITRQGDWPLEVPDGVCEPSGKTPTGGDALPDDGGLGEGGGSAGGATGGETLGG